MKKRQAGQGLVEYALILILVAVVVIVILAMLGPTISNMLTGNPCAVDQTNTDCRKWKVTECMKDEKFTRAECVELVGSGGS